MQTQRIEAFATQNGQKPEDLMNQLKDWSNIADNNKSFADKFTNRDLYGQAAEKERLLKTRPAKASKNLSEFAASNDEDLSEREDEDIYSHYMEQMRRAKQDQAEETLSAKLSANERLAKEKLTEMEGMFPEMPRFEGFFNSQAEGKHPFESDEYQKQP